jgi:hypothetical protein
MQQPGALTGSGVGFFLLGEHPPQKDLPAPLQRLPESGKLHHIHPTANLMCLQLFSDRRLAATSLFHVSR